MARVAVVTGGTRGIGRAISEALKGAGYKVAANYAGNDEAAKQFSKETGIPVYKFNVADFNACQQAVKKIAEEIGPVEVLINNAGITRDTTINKMTFEQWNEVIQTNLASCFNMCRAVIEGMRERKFGRIVNIGSINGQAGQYGQVNYAAAKSGLHGFTKALAQEGASSDDLGPGAALPAAIRLGGRLAHPAARLHRRPRLVHRRPRRGASVDEG